MLFLLKGLSVFLQRIGRQIKSKGPPASSVVLPAGVRSTDPPKKAAIVELPKPGRKRLAGGHGNVVINVRDDGRIESTKGSSKSRIAEAPDVDAGNGQGSEERKHRVELKRPEAPKVPEGWWKVPILFGWKCLKALLRPIGNRTRFGQLRYRVPPSGPRKWIWKVTGGRWNFGPTFKQRQQMARAEIENRSVPSTFIVASFGGGGGTGKTTNATATAEQFDSVLDGRPVLLIDKNPSGTVASVTGITPERVPAVLAGHAEEACLTTLQAHKNLHKLNSFADVQWRFASEEGSGLFVLIYPEGRRLTTTQLMELISKLSKFFSVIVFDCDQDFNHPDTEQVLEMAHVIAVVTVHKADQRLEQAAEVLHTLETDPRYGCESGKVVLVINKVWFNPLHLGTSKSLEIIQEFRRQRGYEDYRGAVATLPKNWRIGRGKQIRLRKRSPWFRLHVLELVAMLTQAATGSSEEEVPGSSHMPLEARQAG